MSRYCSHKDIDKLVRELLRAGATVRITGKNHTRVYLEGCPTVTIASSPSDAATIHIIRKQLRPMLARLGLS